MPIPTTQNASVMALRIRATIGEWKNGLLHSKRLKQNLLRSCTSCVHQYQRFRKRNRSFAKRDILSDLLDVQSILCAADGKALLSTLLDFADVDCVPAVVSDATSVVDGATSIVVSVATSLEDDSTTTHTSTYTTSHTINPATSIGYSFLAMIPATTTQYATATVTLHSGAQSSLRGGVGVPAMVMITFIATCVTLAGQVYL